MLSGKRIPGVFSARAPGGCPRGGPQDACRPARGWLAHQVPGGFNCAASCIFLLPPPLSHKASPSGQVRGHEERHTALASPCRALESRSGQVILWTLPFIFPGTAAVPGQGLAEAIVSKLHWKSKGAAWHSPCPGLGCLLWLLALCPGWQSQGQWELMEGPGALPAGRGDPRERRLLWERERKTRWWAESLGGLAKATHARSGRGGGLGCTHMWSHHPCCHACP